MVIVDSSAVLAAYLDCEMLHADVKVALDAADAPLVLSPYVIAEVDHLLLQRRGVMTELAVLRDHAGGAWELAQFDEADLNAATDVIAKYADEDIGVTDASIVVLAKRYGTRTIATLDRRHFEVLRPLDGGWFTIVP